MKEKKKERIKNSFQIFYLNMEWMVVPLFFFYLEANYFTIL